MIKITIAGKEYKFEDDELSTGAEKAEWFLNEYNRAERVF